MTLVGDVIQATRDLIPDRPQTLPAPTVNSVSAGGGGSIPAGTYYVVVTQLNNWGESAPSSEFTLTLATTGSIVVSIAVLSSILVGGPSAINIYIGTAAGQEFSYTQVTTFTSPTTIVTIDGVTVTLTAGTPPAAGISTAYLPDTNGNKYSAAVMYRWLNNGMARLSRIVNGLLDYCGVPTQTGNPLYVMPGEWLVITDVWYGGYWIQGGKRGDFFRRDSVTSQVLNNVTVSINTQNQVMEVSYLPDRNSGVTATTAAMITANDTSVGIANPSAFLLPFGFARISSPFGTTPQLPPEIVSYSQMGPALMSGMVRGIGATVPTQWPINSVVTELSLFWCGRRVMSTTFDVGDSLMTLPAPVGWADMLPLYMLAQAKKSSREFGDAKQLLDEFESEATKWMYANRGVASYVQVGGSPGTLIYDRTPAGGIIVP